MPSLPCGKHRLLKNAFLRGHKIIAVTKEFVATGENSFYSELCFVTKAGS